MPALKVCNFRHRDSVCTGFLTGEKILPLEKAYGLMPGAPKAPPTLDVLVGDLSRHMQVLQALAARSLEGDAVLDGLALPLDEARLLAPILRPGKIFCAGANYRDHVARMVGPEKAGALTADTDPFFFMKGENAVCGTGDVVPVPKGCLKLDWEIELAIVIGRKCRNVPVDAAAQYVGGYTVLLDMSARDLSRRPPTFLFPNDFTAGKAFDHAAPMGPCLLLKQPEEPVRNFELRLHLNGDLRQSSNTSHMIVSPEKQLSWLSQRITLNPGDIIATGTPAGTGYETGTFLQPGDVLQATIPDIGTLLTTVVATE